MKYINRSALIRKLELDFRKCCEDCHERGCAENCLDCILKYGIRTYDEDYVDLVKCRDCPKKKACNAFVDDDDFCLTTPELIALCQPEDSTLMQRFTRCE